MRLTTKQAQIIKTASQNIYGQGTEVYLFGSRVDDSLKGGDIDLYILPAQLAADPTQALKQRLKLNTELQIQLGEQKIDLIIAQDPSRLIEQEALKTGIKL